MAHEASGIAAFSELRVWSDPVPRPGPENMAVDEALLEAPDGLPILRFYQWSGDWISLGYFQNLSEARRLFADHGLGFVRRMTGGGIVDHRNDLTYSLIVPRGLPLADSRGDGSYRIIHRAVAAALQDSGIPAQLMPEDDASDSAACFDKAVAWDVAGEDGRKLAGAGQKRNRVGLLHQGSILVPSTRIPSRLAEALAGHLAADTQTWSPDAEVLVRAADLAAQRYASNEWLARR